MARNLRSGLRQSLNAGLAGGFASNDIFTTASLDLNFAKYKNIGSLVDFSRASSGTYVGSDGLIKTATTNYLLWSEEFDNASWVNSGTLVTANTAVAPNGTLTADTLTPDVLNLYQTFSNAINTYTASVFIKSAGATSFTLSLVGGLAGLNGGVVFSFATNTESSTGTVDSVSSQSIGNGWYRVIATLTATGTATPQFRLAPTSGDVYIWGAQLEQSSTVGEYIPTTSTINSAPRFDHDPTTGESLGLLVEEQRVNYCLQSEAFGTSPWSASNVTVTANTETSPASTLTADTLAATSANGTVTQPVTTTAVDMTFSVYLKRKTGTGNIDITADGSTWVTQTINSSTWTRCIVTQTAVAGTSNPGVRIVTSGDEVYAWGGQYE